jgi:putative oxidoreductase
MNIAYTLGRIFIPVVFIVEAIQNFLAVGEFAKRIAATQISIPDEITKLLVYVGNPPPYEALAYLIIAAEIICGLMVIIGLKARWAALILAVFAACTIIFVYPFWEGGADQIASRTEALHYLSILGGLLLIVAVGPGPSAVDDR